MCRMVGVVFRREFPMEFLCDLRSAAEHGKVPDIGDEPPGHRDGWGIWSFKHGWPHLVGKSARPAHADESFDSALADVDKLERPNILIAHVRRGSKGGRTLENTHPFVSGNIVFAHNGTVKEFHPETTREAKGGTDSERLFMLFMDRMDAAGDVVSALRTVVQEDIPRYRYTGLVLLVSDGSRLYCYRDYGEGQADWYYNLKLVREKDRVVLFQETGLELDPEPLQVEKGELVVVDKDLGVERIRLA
jgi:predicted glutamine amidotransferase